MNQNKVSKQKKKGAQKYQNSTKFKLNELSKKTIKIQSTPLDHLCQRCFEQIKWKIDYKKYKPLTTPARCTDCKQKSIIKAYRALCDKCADKKVDIEPKFQLLLVEQKKHDIKLAKERAAAEQAALEAEMAEAGEESGSDQGSGHGSDQENEEHKSDQSDLAADADEQPADQKPDDASDDKQGAEEHSDPEAVDLSDVPQMHVDESEPEVSIPKQSKRCSKCTIPCLKYAKQVKSAKQQEEEEWAEDDRIREVLDTLKEREKRTLIRKLRAGIIDFNVKTDQFYVVESNEEYKVGNDSDDDY